MTHRIAKLLVLPLLLPVFACEQADDEDGAFRQANPFVPGHAGLDNRDEDVVLYEGDDEDDEDIIYDIKNDTQVFDPAGALLLTMNAHEIYDAVGNLTCIVEDGEITDQRVRRVPFGGDAEDAAEVLFSIKGNRIYAGDDPTGTVIYSFAGDHVFAGPIRDHEVLITGSVNLAKGTAFRKLLIAALAAGECGAPGI